MSSEKYHYEPGAIHNDHHKEINIGSVPERAIGDIIKNFFKDDAEEAEFEEIAKDDEVEQSEQDNPPSSLNSASPFTPAVIDTTIADAVITLLRQLMEGKTKPKDVLMPVRAAMEAGVIRRPTWEEFCQEFGSWRLKSKTSFSDYTNPDKSPYTGADFQMMKEKFRQLMSDGQ